MNSSTPTDGTEQDSGRIKKPKLTVREMVIFAMLGALMYALKFAMAALPNIHPLGVLTMVYTLVYRKKALVPIYVYVLLEGLFGGFALWWFPYLYLWTVLWGITMLLPKKMPAWCRYVVYPVVCGLYGLAFGTLYAPAQALMFGLSFKGTVAWIVAGLPFDALNAAGNFAGGFLIVPLSELLRLLNRGSHA